MLTAFGVTRGCLDSSRKPITQHRIDTGTGQRFVHASPCRTSQIGPSNATRKRGGERGKIGTLIAAAEDQPHGAVGKRR